MSLEKIVRPAQMPETSPAPQPRKRRTAVNWQPVVLKWGVGGNLTQESGSISEQFTAYQIQKPTEKQAP